MVNDPFTSRIQQQYSENPSSHQVNPYRDPFSQRSNAPEFKQKTAQRDGEIKEQEEGIFKSTARTLLQPVMGFLSTTAPGLASGFFQMLASGEMYDPEAIEGFKRASEQVGIPFDEEAYLNAANTISEYIPTVHNLGRFAEEKTGIPFQPKTRFQKGVRFATEAGRLAPEGATLRPLNVGLPKPALGIGIEATKEALQEMGMNEQLAELASFAILKQPAEGASRISMGKSEKPSGLKERQFENVKEPRKITEARHEKVTSALEDDFKKISEDIIKESPLAETHEGRRENPLFKSEIEEQFGRVEELAEKIPKEIHTDKVKKYLVDQVMKKKGTGFAPGEYDKDFRRFIAQYIKETPKQNIGAVDLVRQYRKNNKELSGAYDPSKSRNYNEAKKDALLEYNRALGSAIEKEFPGTEFAKLFPETNKKWAQVMDSEKINNFVDSTFKEGKIDFNQARKFFDNKHQTAPFKRALGEQYPKFEQLMKDLLTTEKPYKMLQVAKSKGWGELFETAGLYVLNPKIAAAKKGYDFAKDGIQRLINMSLDKPKFTLKWHSAIDNLKKGNFAKAQTEFDSINNAVNKVIEKEAESIKPSEIKAEAKTQSKEAKVKPEEIIEGKAEKIESQKPESSTAKVQRKIEEIKKKQPPAESKYKQLEHKEASKKPEFKPRQAKTTKTPDKIELGHERKREFDIHDMDNEIKELTREFEGKIKSVEKSEFEKKWSKQIEKLADRKESIKKRKQMIEAEEEKIRQADAWIAREKTVKGKTNKAGIKRQEELRQNAEEAKISYKRDLEELQRKVDHQEFEINFAKEHFEKK